jgi:hypothetical protein
MWSPFTRREQLARGAAGRLVRTSRRAVPPRWFGQEDKKIAGVCAGFARYLKWT